MAGWGVLGGRFPLGSPLGAVRSAAALSRPRATAGLVNVGTRVLHFWGIARSGAPGSFFRARSSVLGAKWLCREGAFGSCIFSFFFVGFFFFSVVGPPSRHCLRGLVCSPFRSCMRGRSEVRRNPQHALSPLTSRAVRTSEPQAPARKSSCLWADRSCCRSAIWRDSWGSPRVTCRPALVPPSLWCWIGAAMPGHPWSACFLALASSPPSRPAKSVLTSARSWSVPCLQTVISPVLFATWGRYAAGAAGGRLTKRPWCDGPQAGLAGHVGPLPVEARLA